MDYTHLGRSGVSVSRLCLGTMNFGSFTDAAGAGHREPHSVIP
jgi:aryl-alcohol dehydrogenase-like predicted oxidoreductase